MTDVSDIDWLGLEQRAPGEWSFELTGPLSRFDGKFYGGTGIAVTTALMEAETGRDPVWASVQFVGSADLDDRIDCRVEVLAAGRRTSQVRVTAHVGDRLMLVAIGSTGEARPNAVNAQIGAMPEVEPPDINGEWRPNVPFPIDMSRPSWLSIADLREVKTPHGYGLWARMKHRPQTFAS